MDGPDLLFALAALLVLAGVFASKVSSRLGVPALLLFLGVGMLAGSDGFGGIEFTSYAIARDVGVVALSYILFAGGLSTQWKNVRPVIGPTAVSATIGVAITAGVAGVVAMWALDLPLLYGLLVGAIVCSTDAAAVFSVLRSRSVGLRGQVRPFLELESASNDPMAVFLTVGVLELITHPAMSPVALVPMFFQQMLVGAVVGTVIALATVRVLDRVRLDYDGLYPVVTLAVVVLVYATAALAGGSGFLAVYLAGLVLGNSQFVHKGTLVRFHDAIAWLAQISMFLVLGLLVFPSRIPDVAGPALVVAVALVVVARPVAMLLTLAFSRFDLRQRLLISWVGLRGAAPIILATFPLVAGVDHGETIFDVVFFVVVVSVLVQGTTIPRAARLLGVDEPLEQERPYPIESVAVGQDDTSLHELTVSPGAPADGATLLQLALPNGSLIALVKRGNEFVVPQGSTQLVSGDKVLVLADPETLKAISSRITDGRDGPTE